MRKRSSSELRTGFLRFFKERGHAIVPSSSLLTSDPSVLFTTAGMQQFKPYYLGEESPWGKSVASSQKCFRTSDIEEVGDAVHLTFLEMLGNFSFGGYFKEEAIRYAYEYVFSELSFPAENVFITYFKGDNNVPEDTESKELWKKLGVKEDHIHGYDREDNFWGPTGKEGPCGPTAEVHVKVRKAPCEKGERCIPNCSCGRYVEVWNIVFNEYFQNEQGELSPLSQKGVDTGMGLERLAMIVQGKENVYETDLFSSLMERLSDMNPSHENPAMLQRGLYVIADHIKGASFLASEGITPSNVEQGYIVRRVLRRAMRFADLLSLPKDFFSPLVEEVTAMYKDTYPELEENRSAILSLMREEQERFSIALERGMSRMEKMLAESGKNVISGSEAFDLYQNYGFPLELIKEIAAEKGIEVEEEGFWERHAEHQEISKKGAEKKFGGIGENPTYEATKLHTATHLLHKALREVLGDHVKQMGSDITSERLRFDFSHPQKISSEEKERIESLVNEKIKDSLPVKKTRMSLQEALDSGALAFFKEKYPDSVTVYEMGEFSKEICGGPHVQNTSELGTFRIIKEGSVSVGVRRIKAVVE